MSQPSIRPGEGSGAEQERQELAVGAFQRVRVERVTLMSMEALATAAQQHPQDLRYQDALWKRLRPEIERAVNKRFANLASDAHLENADLLGESFLVLIESIKHFNPQMKRPFWPYYLTGLVHRFISLAQRNNRIELQELNETVDNTPNGHQDTALLSEYALMEDLFPADVKDRDLKLVIFHLHRFGGLTIPDLAKRYGKAVGTIHGWLVEVRIRLEEALRESE